MKFTAIPVTSALSVAQKAEKDWKQLMAYDWLTRCIQPVMVTTQGALCVVALALQLAIYKQRIGSASCVSSPSTGREIQWE